ncbi:MAG: 50S ribosomal protein L4 [Candidatus Ryanbacteria bacterium RIFCSPLOWO2_12_FULL_47_9c]|uniref:Large ribosomal subunit protein uL4 n=1 Tax=Candidatus Ryanbacteria bacterium RIFCSPLOWO2_12_FULL_47_9c TaxID=1802131 RepID=A0A1G2H4I3_9BACT|nr:MAG: 50S ribosomal protein L4 [Candidatus Ryanbacteria bacterium RIFCSPLOWO2_12_FULL_47_9c]
MKAPLYNQEGTKIGVLELPDKLFGVRWNPTLVHDVLLALRSSRRRATAHAKGRGEVRGGGRKPWRQKGTGRALHGSRRSPIWIGGGVTHGPTKEKNYAKKANIKVRRGALASLLSKKFKEGEIFFVDDISLSEFKTKVATKILKSFSDGVGHGVGKRGGRALLLLEKTKPDTIRAFRNLPYVEIGEARNVNVESALVPKYLLFTKEAVEKVTF